MTARDKPDERDPVRGWEFVQKLIDEDEIERIAALSGEEVAAELEAAGYTRRASADELLAKAKAKAMATRVAPSAPVAPSVPLALPLAAAKPSAAPRAVRTVWLLAAAAAGLAAVVEGPHIVESIWPHPVAKAPGADLLRAEALREQAFASLALGARDGVREKLDEARSLDPAGENDPRVQDARRALARPESPPAPTDGDPKP